MLPWGQEPCQSVQELEGDVLWALDIQRIPWMASAACNR